MSIYENSEQSVGEHFPYRFLLRWTWCDHIERLLRRLLWLWLIESGRGEVTSDEFERLGGYVCWRIVVHPDTPASVLDVLAHQGNEVFSIRVAEHPNSWPTTLTRLSKHTSPRVRAAVAENHNISFDVMESLSHDESADVRYAVAENARTPISILQRMTRDENCHVAARANSTVCKMKPIEPAVLRTKRVRQKTAASAN